MSRTFSQALNAEPSHIQEQEARRRVRRAERERRRGELAPRTAPREERPARQEVR